MIDRCFILDAGLCLSYFEINFWVDISQEGADHPQCQTVCGCVPRSIRGRNLTFARLILRELTGG